MSSKPDPSETLARRNLIKKWFLEEGLTNKEEIRRRLDSEHGIRVARQTIYKDWKVIANLSLSDYKEFRLDILGIFKKLIRRMEHLIEQADNAKDEAYLIKSLSQIMKDRNQVASTIAGGRVPGDSKKGGGKAKEEVNITFGGGG